MTKLLETLSVNEVQAIAQAQGVRYTGADLARATRTEVHAALQLKNPPPYSDHPTHLPKDHPRAFTRDEKDAILAHQRVQVTDAEHIAFSRARGQHGYLVDGHHYAQWLHGKALWEETDRLLTQVFGGAS